MGRIFIVGDIEKFIEEKNLGPDALNVDGETLREILASSRGIVKSTLMNQRLIAGIGNIYSDEILFQSAIHPLSRAAHLKGDKIEGLLHKVKEVLGTAIKCRANPKRFPTSYLLSIDTRRGCVPIAGEGWSE